LFYVLLDRAGADAGVWPVCAARMASAACVVPAALVVLRGRLGVPRAVLPGALAAGVLDMTANVLFAVALTVGQLAVVAPVSSLYPASTVLLALLVDRERLRPRQYVGLGLAGAALALVAGA
jgi:drug/metabolite transporter (DMT)-like permease